MNDIDLKAALTRAEAMNERLSDQLFNLQTNVEVAQEDLARRDQAYFEHIGKVRKLLGPIGSEDDLYEAIRRAGLMRTLSVFALRQLAGGGRVAPILKRLDDYADSLAGMQTANAKLYRENIALQQELAALKNEEEKPA